MKYELRIKPSAAKELERLQDHPLRRIDAAIVKLADTLRPAGCEKLTGTPTVRPSGSLPLSGAPSASAQCPMAQTSTEACS